jgi:hypothetical protein
VPDGVTLKPETPVNQTAVNPLPVIRSDRSCTLSDLMGRVVASGKENSVNRGVRPGVYIARDVSGKLSRYSRHLFVYRCQ